MTKPINHNIIIPQGFALEGLKTDFIDTQIQKGFDPIAPDVLSGDSMNKFIDDTYKGLNYSIKGVEDLYKEGIPQFDRQETYPENAIVKSKEDSRIVLFCSLRGDNCGNDLTNSDMWRKVDLTGSISAGLQPFSFNTGNTVNCTASLFEDNGSISFKQVLSTRTASCGKSITTSSIAPLNILGVANGEYYVAVKEDNTAKLYDNIFVQNFEAVKSSNVLWLDTSYTDKPYAVAKTLIDDVWTETNEVLAGKVTIANSIISVVHTFEYNKDWLTPPARGFVSKPINIGIGVVDLSTYLPDDGNDYFVWLSVYVNGNGQYLNVSSDLQVEIGYATTDGDNGRSTQADGGGIIPVGKGRILITRGVVNMLSLVGYLKI